MKKKKKDKIIKILNIIGIIIAVLFGIFTIVGIVSLVRLNIIPTKFIFIFVLIVCLFEFILINILVKSCFKIWFKIATMILCIVISAVVVLGNHYVNKTIEFLDNVKVSDTVVESYYIVVSNNSNYNDLSSLDGMKVGTFKENLELYDQAINNLIENANVSLIEYDAIDAMARRLMNNDLDSMIISAAHKGVIDTDLEGFFDSTKIIHTIDIEVELENVQEHVDINISKKPIVIYISGMDSYGKINSRGRSDVNMLITLNTNTKEVLLTSIPRDYYVQLSGTTGYKDKLTHAGFYGIDVSINTIEEFLGIDIDGYVKVNFSTLVSVIDSIGGIDVYSDKSFVPWTNKSLYINKGTNHMNGAMALAFARERMTYTTGDRHRIQNQQDVITAVVNKLVSSPVLLTNYSSILNSLNGTFETNVDMENITSLVKMQLDENPSWTIKKYNLNGFDHSGYTHTFGNQLLYVMKPDEKTIEQANKYINGMLDGKNLKELGFE